VNVARLSIRTLKSGYPRRCAICEKIRFCFHQDADFDHAGVCQECSGFVIIAECRLLDAGFLQPGKSKRVTTE
jgi:hypothetical protein